MEGAGQTAGGMGGPPNVETAAKAVGRITERLAGYRLCVCAAPVTVVAVGLTGVNTDHRLLQTGRPAKDQAVLAATVGEKGLKETAGRA